MTKSKIFLIPFPFDDLTSAKVRPALCLTDPIGPHRHIILAFISSQVPDNLLETDIPIYSDEAGFPGTGLKTSSVLRLHRLMTVTTTMLRRELGELPPQLQKEIRKKLKNMFKF